MRGEKEMGVRLFSLVSSNRRRGRGHKLKHRKFYLNIRKIFFTVRMTKHWNQLPRQFMELPSLKMSKSNCTCFSACPRLYCGPCFEQGERLKDLQRFLAYSVVLCDAGQGNKQGKFINQESRGACLSVLRSGQINGTLVTLSWNKDVAIHNIMR